MTRTILNLTAAAILATTALPAIAAPDIALAKRVFNYIEGKTEGLFCKVETETTTKCIKRYANGISTTLELSDFSPCTTRMTFRYPPEVHEILIWNIQATIRFMGSDLSDEQLAEIEVLPVENPNTFYMGADEDRSTRVSFKSGYVAIEETKGKLCSFTTPERNTTVLEWKTI